MAMLVQELKDWIAKQEPSEEVFIDEGGLTLYCGDHYIEVGGAPNSEDRYTNYYVHCKVEWNDNWSCMSNDECPNCHGEIEPYASLDNDGTGSPDDTEHHVGKDFTPEDGWPEGITKATELEGW